MTTPNIDDLLLDIAIAIELSDRDRQVAESRYRKLKEHLEKERGPLLPYLAHDKGHIYAQGSIATGTTIVSGTEEDRFDLDALVEINIPPEWSPEQPLNFLHEALKNFPDAEKVVRCTRCVQIQFAFMHMDVTVMDPSKGIRIERSGEIFHSPDIGAAKRVPANPYGFSMWFRNTVNKKNEPFAMELNKRRKTNGMDRLSNGLGTMDAKQDDLPRMLPPRLDSVQVIALKLMKRHLNICYQRRNAKRPPSIYLSKLAAEIDVSASGLFAQLQALANSIYTQMQIYITTRSVPDERNPSYEPDKLNDRWPQNQKDMEILHDDMSNLLTMLERAKMSDFKEITKIFSELFGEKITQKSIELLLGRATNAADMGSPVYYEKESGTAIPSKSTAPSIMTKPTPKHNFHCEIIKKK